MIKPQFVNLEIDFWLHRGKLGVAEPSLCLFHRSKKIGAPILDALNELEGETCPVQRTLTFAACSRKRPIKSLRLLRVAECEDLRVMSIRRASDCATVEMTDKGLGLMIHAFAVWLDGGEDFGISPGHSDLKWKELGKLDRESGELWFWGPSYDGP